ncbi:MAG TPA: hypothetical protein VFG50_03815 [Rhodothermales bacterium]|nr:hypothetical protein [Rhodothermales bacterium]
MPTSTLPDGPHGFEEALRAALGDPQTMERIYRHDPGRFAAVLPELLASQPGSLLLRAWQARLSYEAPTAEASERSWLGEIAVVVVFGLLAGTYADLPNFFPGIDQDVFTAKNLGLFVFPFLTLYFVAKRRPSRRQAAWLGGLIGGTVLFMNLLPGLDQSDTVRLAALHVPVLLWTLAGVAYTADGFRSLEGRIEYVKLSGEAVAYAGLIAAGGAALTGITLMLFRLIGLEIEEWYFQYVFVYGAAGVPLVATAITYYQGRARIAPLLARVFGPLVLLMLVAYLATMLVLQKSPYTDREFLLAFNLMLFGVLVLVTLSIAERPSGGIVRVSDYVNAGMVAVGLILDLVALSAIVFRLASYGFTPNRIALLGANLLIFVHLGGILVRYVAALRAHTDTRQVDAWTARYIIAYTVWAAFLTFLFPLLYSFK